MSEAGSSRTDRRTARAAAWQTSAFWDEVEVEIEAIDWLDLVDFALAAQGPFDPPAGFQARLRADLAGLVRRRFAQ